MSGLRKYFMYLAIIAWVVLPQIASACSVCYGAGGVDSPMIRGMNMAVLFLLGVTGVVLGGIAGFGFYLWRRSKMASNELHGVDAAAIQSLASCHAGHVRHTSIWHLEHSRLASGRRDRFFSFLRGAAQHRGRFHPRKED